MYTDTRRDTDARSRSETGSNGDIEFSHFVVVKSEGSVIGFSNSGSIYKLLMDTATAWIRIHSTDQWIELPEKEAERIRQRAQESFGRTPVYRIPRFAP